MLKFLFVVPLITIMIMAFRKDDNMPASTNMLSLSGIIFDKATELPISGAVVRDSASGVQTISDKNGFYILTIPVKNSLPFYIHVDYQKKGYPLTLPLKCTFSTQKGVSENMVVLAGLVNERDISRRIKPSLHLVPSSQTGSNAYSYALEKFEDQLFQQQTSKLVQHSTKPVWIIDGIPYAFMEGGSAWFDKEEVIASPECKVWFDGKIMSIGEANNTINRLEIKNIGVMPKAQAKKILGVDCNVLMLAKDSSIPRG